MDKSDSFALILLSPSVSSMAMPSYVVLHSVLLHLGSAVPTHASLGGGIRSPEASPELRGCSVMVLGCAPDLSLKAS